MRSCGARALLIRSTPGHNIDVSSVDAVAEGKGLGDMVLPDQIGAPEIGDGSGNAQYAGKAARRQVETTHGLFGQGPRIIGQADLAAIRLRIGERTDLAATLPLRGPRCSDTRRHQFGRFAWRRARKIRGRDGLDLHGQIDAIKQGSTDARQIVLATPWGTVALTLGVAEMAAAAGIHGGYQLKAGRIGHMRRRPRDGRTAGFQRLAQHLQHLAGKFRQLVEE